MRDEQQQKPWYESKIIIVNLIAGVVETVQMLSEFRVIDPGVATIICNAITIWLRIYQTKVPIGSDETTIR